ncbi:hypothetical protein PMI18_05061 [Pseudomonas sp. GM102]|uniref:hypothetical protein n=1 Tax=Pseudomonas sp. GM102 TaxID=1144321 RepID=UPI00026FACBD|nr:hypothetical protein [Pseudomonas sp. GM102]EJL95779.1 hypothetical protein PMI18_05061 [Pseudomonas sp. GM102]
MNKWILALVSMLSLGGCVTASNMIERADESKPISPQKAIIVGFVSEGFLTQPHGLNVLLKYHDPDSQAKATRIALTTLDQNNEVRGTTHIMGNSFVFEVPPGTYEVTHWYYRFYDGLSADQKKPLLFSVKRGDAVYIGNFHANSLTMCLSNRDDFAKAIVDIKKAHPFLANVAITDLSQDLQFPGWPNTKATDVFGKGLCMVQ